MALTDPQSSENILRAAMQIPNMNMRTCINALCLLLVVLQDLTNACRGPGGRPGFRERQRPMTPLVFKQHIPNMSEGTIGASGPSEGRISRDDERFRDLVANFNPQIVFRDEERTNADRMMTKRCRDRVNTLAILVGSQWPGVKLRVTEAWDEDGVHKKGSLHYEGRAVDITTDDIDLEKYGMLARLAVEAGFDWVFYESKHHVHASVVADDSDLATYGGCFAGESTVITDDGETKHLSDLQVGDRVLTMDRYSREAKFSDVIMMMHEDMSSLSRFVEITYDYENTTRRGTITLTGNHLLYVYRHSRGKNLKTEERKALHTVFASDVEPGDTVIALPQRQDNFTLLSNAKILSVRTVLRRGVYAPLTEEGTLIIDGVVASCYAVFGREEIAHALFLPFRMLWDLGVRWSHKSFDQGLHWYPKSTFDFAKLFLPQNLLRLS